MSWEDPEGAGIGVIREEVEIDLGPVHLPHLKTIVDPVIVADIPTVLWCPHGHELAVQALLGLIDVILVDSDEEPICRDAITRSVALLRSAYVVDLAWLRTTPWRERLASAFDLPRRRGELDRIAALAVRHRPASTVSGLLLAGWLAARLHWEPDTLLPRNGSALRGAARRGRAQVEVELDLVDQNVPGLSGVTVQSESGFLLALDRAPGGLRAHSRSPDGREATWQVLGASRGEGGILGEGVRQALLRDPTYGPSLGAAHAFCPP
jgi:hypothetical protein